MPILDFSAALCARISRHHQLKPEERAAIEATPARIVKVPASHAVVHEGDKPSHSVMVLRGVACTSRTLAEGRRQIMAFHIREDMPDLLSLHLEVMDSDLSAINDCVVAVVEHSHIRQLCHAQPRIADALWRLTLVDAAIFRQWVVNVGARGAEQRLAHLLMEHLTRMAFVGLGEATQCSFPMTQSDLAQATGMSTVHVNRSLQSLRAAGLIELAGKTLRVPNPAALARFSEFSPAYLHLPEGSLAPGSGK
jgi:CRP-like cAMP-binding protein